MATQEVTNLNINFHLDMLTFLDVDHCFRHRNPCSRINGQCVSPPGASEAQCVCNPGFIGKFCQCK